MISWVDRLRIYAGMNADTYNESPKWNMADGASAFERTRERHKDDFWDEVKYGDKVQEALEKARARDK